MSPAERVLWRAALGRTEGLCGLTAGGWAEVLRWAAEEGTEGLLYQRCVQDQLSLPPPVRQRLAAAHLGTAARNVVTVHQLGEVLAGLARRGLEVVVLPGLCLLPLLPDPGWRPMDDVDLLLDPGAAHATHAALLELGLRPVPRHASLLCRGDLVCDLHADPLDCWRVRSRRHAGWISAAHVWEERRAAVVEGVPMSVPSAEHALLYTAVHALKHAYRRLVWFVDLAALVGQVPDWEQAARRARQCGAERALLYGLWHLHHQVGLPLPEPVRRWVEARPLRPAERVLLGRALADRAGAGWGDLLWSLSARGVRRWQLLTETCFPRPAVLLQIFPRLPVPLLPLAYPLRLGQVMGRAVRLVGGLLGARAAPQGAGTAGH